MLELNNKQFLQSGNYFLDEIKTRAEKGSPHFFDTDSMRFFSSRISELAWKIENKIYFITSEQNKGTANPRGWTVRICDKDGDLQKLGEFQEYSSLNEARKAIKGEIEK